ncbi:MAG: hypothetical protein WC299_04095, partial [Kiritimatiellia bacterium]
GTPLPYLGIHPCGNLLRPRGYDLPSPTEAGYAKAGGQEPQVILPDVLINHSMSAHYHVINFFLVQYFE